MAGNHVSPPCGESTARRVNSQQHRHNAKSSVVVVSVDVVIPQVVAEQVHSF